MELHLNTYGTYVHIKDRMFEILIEGKKTCIQPEKLSTIVISTAATITTDAIQLALEYNIDVVFLDKFGNPYARVWFPKIGSTVTIRRRQLQALDDDLGLAFTRDWICLKIMNQSRFIKKLISKRDVDNTNQEKVLAGLREYARKIYSMSGSIADHAPSIMGWEGSASKLYFGILADLIPPTFRFEGRSSHPAADAFNAFINYGYGILYSKVERALVIAGLDPYIGFMHTDNYNKKSFVFDFIEPYRTMIDEPVFYAFSRHKFKDEYIHPVHKGVMLTTEGKKFLAPLILEHLDTIHRYHNKNRRLLESIQIDAHVFANYLIGKRSSYMDTGWYTRLSNFIEGSDRDDSIGEDNC